MTRWPICLAALAAVSLTACNPAQQAKQAKNDVDSGSSAACAQERSTIEKALEAYTLLTPDAPVTEAAIVAGGFIHIESALMDIGPGGTVVAAPGSVCA